MPATSQRVAKTDLHRRFCNRVKARRERLGWTQIRAADEMGVSQGRWSEIENGRCMPMLDLVERVATALQCSADDLLEPLAEARTRSRRVPA